MIRIVIFFLFLAVMGCNNKYNSYVPLYVKERVDSIPDYSDLYYWAAHPWKKDPSDSLPSSLLSQHRDSVADVFFIYPTTYTDARKGWNANISDPYINAKTDYSSILYQASVFNQHARVFSPRYRQAHLDAFFSDNESTRAAFDTAYKDIRTAFVFYLEHYNKNQPLIIVGHSQGAKLAERLLMEFFDGKPLQNQLVAAYIIGWPIPQHLFDSIPVCNNPRQTGCFCGWRTFRKEYIPPYVEIETDISYVTNPLSWTTSFDFVPKMNNKGSVLSNFSKIIPHTTGAEIHEGVLWIDKPKFPGSAFFKTRNYHIADINLFYINLRENVEERINAFIKKKK
jgi:hypothetical protein